MLALTVYDYNTGTVLYQSTQQMPSISISGDHVDDCREAGVLRARELTERWRRRYPNASTNIVCYLKKPSEPA
jgi:hypothetical protein